MEASDKWFVYILQCRDGRLYTGMTSDMERRFNEHKTGKGGRFTRSFGIEKLLYKEEHPTRSDALKRESKIKGWSKIKKLALISNNFELLKKL